jgi:hypothetical protein
MNIGRTRRTQLRFRVRIPLIIEAHGQMQMLTPRNMSVAGCYFDFNRPEFLFEGTYHVRVLLDDGSIISIRSAHVFDAKPHGFGFHWKLDAAEEATLFAFLQRMVDAPSLDSKVTFLMNEQNNFFHSFRDIAEQKQRGYRFLFVLIAAYCVYLAAPFHLFVIESAQQAAFYGIGGLWASVILIYHCLRFLHWLGIATRRKALLVHAMAANRSWVFENDPSYYGKSIFPMGARYDDVRAWSPEPLSGDPGNQEVFPLTVSYRGSTTLFHFLVQAFFAFGMILFISIIARSILDKDTLEKSLNDGFRLFNAHFFLTCYSAASILLLGWIHSCARGCAQYQRRMWEARRISSARPNPRFTGEGLKREQPGLYKWSNRLAKLIWVYAALSLPLIIITKYFSVPLWVSEHVNSWIATTIVLALFLGGRIVYIGFQIRAEANLDKNKSAPVATYAATHR